MLKLIRLYAAAAAVAAIAAGPAFAAEGMWTFDNFPAAKVKAELGVSIDKDWLNHIQAAAITIRNTTAARP